MQSGIIDLEKVEMQTGPQMRMKNALAEERDVHGRNRYIEKVRSAQTIKIIADPDQLGKQYREFIKETTYDAMTDLKKWGEIYLGIPIHHINQYLWGIMGALPGDDEEMRNISRKRPREYYAAIKIRDASKGIGSDFKRNFLPGKRKGEFPNRGLYTENSTPRER